MPSWRNKNSLKLFSFPCKQNINNTKTTKTSENSSTTYHLIRPTCLNAWSVRTRSLSSWTRSHSTKRLHHLLDKPLQPQTTYFSDVAATFTGMLNPVLFSPPNIELQGHGVLPQIGNASPFPLHPTCKVAVGLKVHWEQTILTMDCSE